MRRWVKGSIVTALLLGVAVGAVRWAVLPGVLSYMQATVRTLGLPEAVLRQQGWAFNKPHIVFYAKASDTAPLLAFSLRLLPTLWASLQTGTPALQFAEITFDCASLPENSSAPSGFALPTTPEAPPDLPNLSLYSGEVSVSCAGVNYTAHKFSLMQQSNGLTLEADGFLHLGAQQFAASLGGFWPNDGAFATTLRLDGGVLNKPWQGLSALPSLSLTQKFVDGMLMLSGALTAPVLEVAGQKLEQLDVQFNPSQQSGSVLPITAKAKFNTQSLALNGQLDLAKQSAGGELTGGFKLGVAEVIGLKAGINLPKLSEAVLAPQPFSITALQLGGLPLTAVKGKLGFKGRTVSLSEVQALLFGGQVLLSPTTLTLPVQNIETTASFSNLDLSQIIQLGAVDGLGGTGKLSGKVPVSYKNGKISLGASELTATSTGNIVYNPAQMPSFMAEGGQASMLGQIFKDFAYDGLTLRLGGTLGGEKSDTLTLGVRLAGSNPSFYNGHPVVFNLNLSGALESLLTKGLASFRFSPEDLAQMVKEGEKP